MRSGNLSFQMQQIVKKMGGLSFKKAVLLFGILLLSIPSWASCNCSWVHSVPVTVTNLGASTLSNYQVSITLNTAALVGAGKMQASGNDIRFADASCTNLPYWIESGMNTATTVIWINVNSIAPSTTTTIYLYYGNPVAAAASDGNATFLFFDDFNGVALDGAKWTLHNGGGSLVIGGGTASFSSTSEVDIVSNSSFAFPITSEAKVNSATGNWPNIGQVDNGTANGNALSFGGGTMYVGSTLSNCAFYDMTLNGVGALGGAGTWSMVRTATQLITSWPGGSNTAGFLSHPTTNQQLVLGSLCSGTGNMVVDWYRARKYDAAGTTQSIGAEVSNGCLAFNNGSPQSLSVCISSTNSISSLLTATGTIGSTFNWTVTSGPSHGTIGGLPQSAAGGTNISPAFTTFTPTAGYIGADAFTVQVSDGIISVTTTINVVVNPTPTITLVSPNAANPFAPVTITGTNFNTTAGNNIVYFGATRAAVTSASATSLSVNVPADATFYPVTVENSTCALISNAATKFFLPTYNNASYAPNTVNFDAKVDFNGGLNGAEGVSLVDVDGDGKADLVVASYNSSSIFIYKNTSASGSITAGSFAAPVSFTTGTNPTQIAFSDIDGDGKPDLAVSNQGSGSVSVFRNTSTPGTISLAPQIVLTPGGVPYGIAIQDLDGDGKADLAVTNVASAFLYTYRNTSSAGSISFGSVGTFAIAGGSIGVALGDMNGDGLPDAVCSNMNFGMNSVSVLVNASSPGAISFAAKVDFATGTTPYGVALADIDGDGKLDIITANQGSSNVSVIRNNTFPAMNSHVEFIAGTNPWWVSVGDVDGDGKPDIACTNRGSNTVSVFRNTATSGTIAAGSFANAVGFTTGSSPVTVAIGDLDGDGKPEMAVTSFNSNIVSVFHNNPLLPNTGTLTVCPGLTTTLSNSFAGGGTWSSSAPTIASVVAGTGVVTGILEGGTANITFTTAGTSQVVVSSVTVTATPTVTNISPLVGFPTSSVTITGTNFNTTTTNDVVWFGATRATVNTASATSLTVSVPVGSVFGPVTVENATCGLQAASTGTYLQNYSNGAYIANTVNFDPQFTMTTGSSPWDVALGDIDGDGKSDIVVVNNGSNTITVFRNISSSGSLTSGSFSAGVSFATGSSPIGLAIGDVDGDGKLDVATANSGTTTVSVLRNTSTPGTISFSANVDISIGASAPTNVIIGDVDGDGKPELITCNFSSNNISVLQNVSVPGVINGSSFNSAVNFTAGTNPEGLAFGDIDGDGKPDIGVSNRNSNNISLLRNTSTIGTINAGTLASAVNFGAGTSPVGMRFADIDGDSKLDVVVANNGANNFSVFRNTATSGVPFVAGSLAARVDYGTSSNPFFNIGIGDIDGDGKPDVISTNSNGGSIFVFRNTATSGTINAGSFANAVNFAAAGGTTPNEYVSAVGDLDGDGKADIVVSNKSSASISVLRNDPLQPITGTFVVCQNGPTSTLSEAAIGGTWTSNNPAIATVGATTGVVAGLTAGTTTITYQGTASGLTPGNYTTQTVTVNAQSSAAFTATPNPFCIGIATTFNNASAGITAYAWNFGDAITAAGNNPIHTYAAPGTYTASLQVTNTNGCISSATGIVTVNPLPVAISGSLSVCTGLTTTLSNANPGGTWSSASPGVATINAGSGLVNALTPGTTVITYTLPTGCAITATVTVSQTPAAIGVPGPVCVGSNITLTDAYLPGTGVWTSSNTAFASIIAGSGVLTGVGAGSPVITYTIPATGCFNTATVVVNPLPAAISGTLAICSGLNSTLADATPLGTWSSSTPAVATVGALTGTVNAVGAGPGNSTITYTLPTGCIATAIVTVNPNPASILGTATVCTGFTTTLTDATLLGTWSTSNPTVATVGAGSGVVTGVAPGNATISYTLATGCLASVIYTVNLTPAVTTGTTTVCVGSTTTLSDATAGGTWTTSNPAQATVGALTGIVSGVSNGNPNILYTMPTSCFVSTPITVNPLPLSIGGATNVCVGLTATVTDASGASTWTSSNPTYATVGAATGLVTGLSAGVITITFTLPTGCAVSAPFTVNPSPAAITGATSVCATLTTLFANSVTGGTWSSAAPGTALVNAVSGLVTGVAAGSTNIIYTLPAGCNATKAITVNPQPSAIVGASGVCVGLTTSLTDPTIGGTWSSSNPATATISVGGLVTGITAGTLNLSYTLPAGCFSVQPFTVNPTPAAITGTNVVCVGSNVTLSDVTSGGTWSSSDVGRATVNAATGVVTGVSSGNPSIIYTLPAGCTATYPITVNAVPNIASFATSATSQCTSIASTVTITSASLGAGTFTVIYNLSGANSASASTATLTMGGGGSGTFTIPSGLLANSGATTVTVTQITNNFGCSSALSSGNTSSFTVYPYPVAYTVTGTGGYCAGGTGIHVMLSNSAGGISYQLYLGGVATGAPVAGTFVTLDMGAQTTAGTYTVIGTNTTTLCASNMTGSAIITVNPLPTVYAVTGGGSYCAGGTGVVIGMANSDIGNTYQLYLGGVASGSPVTGTGGAISFGLRTSAGTYTVIATTTATTCTNTMGGSAIVVVNPLPGAITGTASVCPGLTTTLASASPTGTWTSVNTAAATVNAASGVVTGVSAGTSVISYTLPTGCVATTIVTVNPNPSAIIGAGPVCTGSTLALTDASSGGTWASSNVGEATIGAATGIVAGVNAGTPTMTYTLPTGCLATAQVTVNNTPAAITGTTTVCPGQTTLLSSTTAGGSWTSSNSSVATVNAATGLVSGVAAGSPVITYTVNGCFVISTITVNPLPAAITGTASVCVGSSVTLADANPGGTWSSSNPSFATVIALTGVVTGVSAGTLTITYTLPTGCYTTTSFVVNPIPAAITGVNNVCIGLTTNLGNTITGGVWTSSNGALATVIAGTGVVTGVSAGTLNITYTLPGGCLTTYAITVNPNPVSISGANNVCVGLNTALTDATPAGTWSSSNTAIGSISVGGVVTGVSAGNITITYTLATGCINTLPFTVNALPSAITGTLNLCVGLTTALGSTPGGGTWSSSNTLLATVNAGTGVVTGVAAGNPNITYTLPTGCIISSAITVNPTPAAITGANTVCTGLTTALADATSGGTWSSSDLTLATVNAASGVVTGVAAGNVVITYTLPAGCTAILPMTVNTQPAAITGAGSVCTGFTTTLADITAGGTWTSSNTSVATVGALTGVVSGITAGAVTITYTMPGGCTSLRLFTVNQTPSPITGVSNVCVASTATLINPSIGGSWTSSNIGIGTVGLLTGVVTGISAGAITITYTLPAGCNVTYPLTVNPLPAAIAGFSTVCVAATSTLTDATAGGVWSSSNVASAIIGSASGIITGVAAGTTTFTYTLPTACIATMPVTVNALPVIYSVTGGGNYCAGGSGVAIGLSNSTIGINYQVYYNNGVITNTYGTPWAGTGAAINFGLFTGAGVYTVVAINAATGCNVQMNASATVGINVLPTAYTVTWVGSGSYCAGTTGVTVGLSNSTTGVNYQLYLGGVAVGTPVAGITGNAISFGAQVAAGVYTVIATNASTGCTQAMTGTATVVINPLPTLYTINGGGGVCPGGSVAIGLSNSDLFINYTLKQGATSIVTVAGTGSAISFGLQSTLGAYTVTALNTITGCTTTMSGTVSITSNPLPTNTYVLSSTAVSYCLGSTPPTFNLSNTQTGVNYQLMYFGVPSGAPVAGTGLPITFGTRSGAGVAAYTVAGTNIATTCSSTMTGTVSLAINPLPNVYTIYGGGSFCAGGAGSIDSLSGSDIGINYSLVLVGTGTIGTLPGTGLPLSSGLVTTPGTYTAFAQNSLTTCSVNMLGSALITSNPLPTAYAVTGTGSYCAGGAGLHVGLANSDLGINYQVFKAGLAVSPVIAGTGAALDFGFFTAGTYTIQATNAATLCTFNMTGGAVITANPLPLVQNVTGGGSYCAGGTGVHIGLSSSTVGVNYQLYIGLSLSGAFVPGTGAAIDFGLKTAAGSYTVIATNATTLCTNTMSGSATVTITALPTVNNVTGGGAYCAGGTGVHIGLNGSVVGNSYQLYNGAGLSGAAIAGTGLPLDFGFRFLAGTYTVVATNSTTLCTSNMAGSAVINVNALPTLYNVTGGGSYCAGGTGVHVGLNNSTTGVNYQLYVGPTAVGSVIAGTGSSIDFGFQVLSGVYTVVATDATSGCTNNMTGSVSVSINATPSVYTVYGGGNYCAGGTGVHVLLTGSQGGVTYQLYNGLVPVTSLAGTTTGLDFGLMTSAGSYTVVATDNTSGCTANMTSSTSVVITSLPIVYSVSGGGAYCAGGTGVHIGLSNSELGVSYQLYSGTLTAGSPVTGTGSSLDFGLQNIAGTYTVVATNPSSCVSNMAGSAVVSVNPLPGTYTVTGGGSYCAGGTGVNVGLSGSNSGINYQLYRGTTLVGSPLTGTGSLLDFGVQSISGTYTVVAINSATACTMNMTGSVSVTQNALPAVYTVTGGGSYCAGGSGLSVGLSNSSTGISYQLYRGTLAIGGLVGGTGIALDFGIQTSAGTYTVVASDDLTGCTSTMTGSASIVINSLPVAFNVTGGGSYCSALASTLHVGLSGSQFGYNYQLYNGTTAIGAAMAGTGTAIDFGVQSLAGNYTVVAINAGTGCTNTMTGSATITINATPVVYTVTGGGGYCVGGTGVHIFLSGSDHSINYQLYNGTVVSGAALGGSGTGLDFGLLTAAGAYSVVATDPATSCSSNMGSTATVAINALPLTFAVSGGGGYCSGAPGVHVMLNGSESGVNYQLYHNDTPVVMGTIAGTGFALDMGVQSMVGTYTVGAVNATTGCSNTMTSSAVISINPLPAQFTVTGGGNYCNGGTGLNVGLSGSATGINYRLYRGGVALGSAVAGTGGSINFGLQTVSGIYTVIATNPSTGCTSNMTSSVSISVDPLPIVYSVAGGGSYCSGSTGVDVTVSLSETGVSYQLYHNSALIGSPVAGTGSLLHFGPQILAGIYTVVATNNATGCTSNMTGSATVSINSLPVVYNTNGGGSYCAGGTGVTVTLSGSNTGINYQLYNTSSIGGAVPGTGLGLNFGLQTTAGAYFVVATNATTGCKDTMAGSANVTVNTLPSAYALTGGGNYCSGGSGIAIGLIGSNTGISYQLYTSSPLTATGSPVHGNGAAITFGLQTAAATYSVVATDTATGCSSNMTGTVTINVIPTVIPDVTVVSSLGDTVCYGTSVTYSAISTHGGTSPSYSWTINGLAVGSGANYTYMPVNGDDVKVKLTSSEACPSPDTAVYTITMMVRDNLTPDVAIVALPGDTVCTGTLVNFTASSVNGGNAPVYTWFINSGMVATGSTYTYAPSNNDVVYCRLTSNYPCLVTATAISNYKTMDVQNVIAPAVSIDVAYGTSVGPNVYNTTFTATVSAGGLAPTYQWLVNGAPVPGATNATYLAATLIDGQEVSCYAGVNSTCGLQTAISKVIVQSANVGVQPVVNTGGEIRLAPNPNKGQFILSGKFAAGNDESLILEITDIVGQVVYHTNVTTHNGEINERVILGNNLANGMYIVNLRSLTDNKVFHMVVEQ